MGCATSRLDNEDTVRRCKDRRRFMKEAVYARNHLSTAHSDYCRSLRVTGAALVTFASGEPLISSHHAPAVLLRGNSSAASVDGGKTDDFVSPIRHQVPLIPPSPPPPPLSTASSHRHQPQAPPIRRKKPVKLPHILSESSFSSSPARSHNSIYNVARGNSTYASTPSQASSVWNWDNFYPPSPPDSEYFQKLHNEKKTSTHKDDHSDYDRSTDSDNEEKGSSFRSFTDSREHGREFMKSMQFEDQASNRSGYSHYPESHSKSYASGTREIPHKKGQNIPQWDSEDEETEREEVQCSEWGDHDHYSSSTDDDGREDLKSRSDFGRGKKEAAAPAADMGAVKGNPDSKYSAKLKKPPSEDDEKSSVTWGNGNHEGMNLDRRIVLRHQNLSEIVTAIKEYFDKAASAGEQVSEILEVGRAQFDRSFTQLKKTVYHSSGMLSTLSSAWSSKPPLAVKYQFNPVTLEHPGGSKSLCSTMERLLAWEKKLYEEVKAREGVKIEHEKKLSLLQNQEYRGEEEAKVDKTKAAIKRLQSLIVVTSQAVSTTSSSIIELRDSSLIPQLVELCHGLMYMWRSMNQFHEAQNDIVQQVRGLVSQMTKGDCTSDLHRQATCYLESAVSEWHSSFCRLIKFQRDFIRSLHGWFKLTLLPVSSEPSDATRELGKVFKFMDEWKLALDRVPDTVASEAIKSFTNVVHSITVKQAEELKIKKRTEIVSKELEKKASSLRSIEKKYYLSYSSVGIGLPDSGPENGHVFDARDPLAEKKAELAICQTRVEDEMLRHSRAVEVTRAMTLNNLQTGLPGVFQAMTGFSALISESLQTVCNDSYDIY